MYSSLQIPGSARQFHDRIYAGDIIRIAELPAMTALVALTRVWLEDALHPWAPPEIHRYLSHDEQTLRFAQCQNAFARSKEVREHWRAVVESLGLAADALACDRLHLRFQPHREPRQSMPRARTTATIAFHRDTWGSNLYAQTNWWAPIYPITTGRTFALYPHLWQQALRNCSADFDMRAILERSHRDGRNAVDADEAIPHLLEAIDPQQGVAVDIAPGSLIAFSGAHAHAGVGNSTGLTRISFETRSVLIDDVLAGLGAPNIDGHAPWRTPGLFRRMSDTRRLNEILGCGFMEPYRRPQNR
ncbi:MULTISPECIES: hypothetical protein [Pseudomonas]|uniref:hypothetical protein n=1 Tax=Pseudomonas sp. MIL9 TaxID=2807620 RepID=UPI001028B988|nr:hypothetical protein [Pseudomonas sp. MIL9]MBM6442203.1 hypothetical protein [Pseudomonas sp. MIL9]RZO09474.1 hypothetical protein EKG40_08475 [Pseudomonas moorei]